MINQGFIGEALVKQTHVSLRKLQPLCVMIYR